MKKLIFFVMVLFATTLALSADKKLTDLPSLTAGSFATGDLIGIVDISANANKKTTIADFDTRYLAITTTTQSPNFVYSGPISGANAAPTFRLLDPLDIPDLAATKITYSGGGHVDDKLLALSDATGISYSGGGDVDAKLLDLSSPATINFTEQGSTPSTPSAGSKKLYAKTNGKMYTLNSSGLEKQVGSGAGGAAGVNILAEVNPEFEDGVGNWTESGGTEAAATSTNILFDLAGATWDSNGAAQTYCSDLTAIPEGLKGTNGYASIWTKVPSGTATHKLRVYDGSTTVIETSITSTATASRQYLNFPIPTSGSLQLCLVSVAADEPLIAIDKAYLGEATNIAHVLQAQLAGESYWPGTTGCSPTRSSATIGAFTDDTDCTGPTVVRSSVGTWATTDGNNIEQTITNLPPGTYKARFQAYVLAASSGRTYATITDGSTTCEPVGVAGASSSREGTSLECTFNYTAPQSSRTFEMHIANTDAAAVSITNSDTAPRGSAKFILEYWPPYAQTAIAADQTDYDWTQYTPTFTNFGTVSTHDCWHKRQGPDLLLDCKFTTGTPVGGAETRVSLPNSLLPSTTKHAVTRVAGDAYRNVAGADYRYTTVIEPAVSYVVFGAQASATRVPLGKLTGSNFATAEVVGFNARITIQGWKDNNRAPTLISSVTSVSDTLSEKIIRARIASGATITSQSGGIASVASGGTGIYNLTWVAGTFSVAPTCICIPEVGGRICSISSGGVPTTSGVTVTTMPANTVTEANMAFDIICMGPK